MGTLFGRSAPFAPRWRRGPWTVRRRSIVALACFAERQNSGRGLADRGRAGCRRAADWSGARWRLGIVVGVASDGVPMGGEPCVSRVPVFSRLSGVLQGEVARYARPVRVAAGEVVFVAGQADPRLFVVHEGRVKIVRTSVGGRSSIVRTLGPGEVGGELAFLTGARPEQDAIALESSRLCMFAHADLADLLGRFPGIAVGMLQTLAARLGSAERMVAALASADVGARVAAYLLDCPTSWAAAGHSTVRLPVAKKDVASLLGTTPETVSRTLAAFQRDGLVRVRGGDIDILDGVALEARAEGF